VLSGGKWLGALLILAFCTGTTGAQDPACSQRTLPIALRDSQNLPLQNLSVSDLEARVHGKPVKILSIAPDPRPHRVVLILDASASMGSIAGESPLFPLGVALARHFFSVNSPHSQIALLVFNVNATDIVDLTQGNPAVGDKLQQISGDNYAKAKVKRQTALRDAILTGLDLLTQPTSADALYVLTDGGDNASKHDAAYVRQRLAATGVRLFAIVLRPEARPHTQTLEELSGPGDLSDIAVKSGGEILSTAAWHGNQIAMSANAEAKVKSQESLERLYQTIVGDQLLKIELPLPITKDEHLELSLSDTARRQHTATHITYPTTLTKCSPE
jgi:VWA domain-containing protein